MTPHQATHPALPPQKPQALAEGLGGQSELLGTSDRTGLCWKGTALQQTPQQCQVEQKAGLLFLAGHAPVYQLNMAFASLFQTAA